LIIKKINLKDIDDKSPYGYPKKHFQIKTKNGDIDTPSRVITNHEYNQKEVVPTDITLDGKISIFVDRLSYSKLKAFLQEDKPFERLADRLKIQKERAQHSLVNLALLKPTSGKDSNGQSPIDILKSSNKREKFYRMIIQLQKIMGYDPISVPIPNLPLSDAKMLMKETKNSIEKEDNSTIFFFELGKNFPPLLKYATNDLDQNLIGINYKRYTQAVHSYEAIRTYYDKDIAFLVANTKRQDGYFDDLSTMHYLPFLSNDLFASFVPPQAFGGFKEQTPSEKLKSVRLFNRNNLLLERINDASFNVDEILNQVGRPKETTLTNMLLNYKEAGNSKDPTKLNRLKAFTKVHEAKTSNKEFDTLRKHIIDGSTNDYVEDNRKKIFKSVVSRLK